MRREALEQAKARGDGAMTNRIRRQEWEDVAGSVLKSEMQGQDPFKSMDARARHASPEVVEDFALKRLLQREEQLDANFQLDTRMQEAVKAHKAFGDQWRAVNSAPLAAISPFASAAEQNLGSRALKRIPIPEEVSQNWINVVGDYINRQKLVDQDYDPMEDHRISKLVTTLNSMGRRTKGAPFFTGPAKLPEKYEGFQMMLESVALQAGDAIGLAAEKIGESMFTVGLAVLEGTDSEWYKAYQDKITPKYYIDTESGQIAHYDGRVGGLAAPYINLQMLMGRMKVEDIPREVEKIKGAIDWNNQRTRTGLHHYADVLARAVGGLVGMMGSGGFSAIRFGTKGAAQLLKAVPGTKMGALAELLGTGVGYGLYNMGMYGDVEGYGKAFTNAMIEAPIFMVAGRLGNFTNRALTNRKFMPRPARQAISGMMEGLVFSAAEMTHLQDTLWHFMGNPNDEAAQRNWRDVIVGNVLGFGIFKGLTGLSPGRWTSLAEIVGPEGMKAVAARGQQRTARRLAARKLDPNNPMQVEAMADTEGVKTETFKKYAEAVQRYEKETDLEKKAELSRELDVLEEALELEAQGLDRTEFEEIEEESPIIAKMHEAMDLPSGPEKTQRILELKRQARGKLFEKVGETARRTVEREITDPMLEQLGKRQRTAIHRKLGELEKLEDELDQHMSGGTRMPQDRMDLLDRLSRWRSKINKDLTDPVGHLEKRLAWEAKIEQQAETARQREARAEDYFAEVVTPRRLEWEARQKEEGDRGRQEDYEAMVEGEDPGAKARIEAHKAHELARRAKAGEKLTPEEIETVARVLQAKMPEAYDLAKERPMSPEKLRKLLDEGGMEAMAVEAPADFGKQPKRPKSLQLEEGLEPEPGAKEIRPSQIQEIMEGDKNSFVFNKMRGGVPDKAKRAGILGWFAGFSKVIRIPLVHGKRLAVMLHEWSHAAEREAIRFGIWEGTHVPGWMMRDLATVAKTYPKYDKLRHRSKVAEGWAEFWAREMYGDPSLKAEVPRLHKFMMDLLAKPEAYKFKKQHDKIQAAVSDWVGLGAVGRQKMRLGLGGRKPTVAERMGKTRKGVWTQFNKMMTDDVAGAKAIEKEYLKHAGMEDFVGELPITSRPTDLIDVYRMTQGSIADQFMKTGTRSMSGKKTGEGFEEALDEILGKDTEVRKNFMAYLNAQWGLLAIDQGVETPANKAEYLHVIKQLQSPEFDMAAKRVHDWATRVLDYMQEGGVISEGEKIIMQKANPFGLLFREMSEGTAETDPVVVARRVTETAIARTQQSMVARALWLQSHLVEGAGPLASVLEYRPHSRNVKHFAKLAHGDPTLFESFFLSPSTISGKAPTVTFTPRYTKAELKAQGIEGQNLVEALKQVGKIVTLEVDPEIFQVMQTIQAKSWMEKVPHLLRQIIAGPTLAVRAGATVFNWDFIVRNVIRDPLERQLYTKVGDNNALFISGYIATMKGFLAKGGDLAEMFAGVGGEGSAMLRTEFATEPGRGKIVKGVQKVAEWFSEPEIATRRNEYIETYKKLKELGYSDVDASLQAMLESKEITTNFTRRGIIAAGMAPLVPYFTARIAGQRRFWSSVTGRNGKIAMQQAWVRGLLNLGSISALAWWFGKDEKWYQELPVWQRVGYWNFKDPFTGTQLSFPKPWEAGQLMGTGIELALTSFEKFDKDMAKETAWTFIKDIVVDFPFGWLPAIVRPSIGYTTGYDDFTRKQIIPGWMERIELPERQYHHYTTETFKAIGKMFGQSPAKLEHAVNQHTGGIARRLVRFAETVAGLRDWPEHISDLPMLGAIAKPPLRGARSVQRIFDLDEELAKLDRAGTITSNQRRYRKIISAARRRISAVAKKVRDKKMSRIEGDKRKVEIAAPVIKRYERYAK